MHHTVTGNVIGGIGLVAFEDRTRVNIARAVKYNIYRTDTGGQRFNRGFIAGVQHMGFAIEPEQCGGVNIRGNNPRPLGDKQLGRGPSNTLAGGGQQCGFMV